MRRCCVRHVASELGRRWRVVVVIRKGLGEGWEVYIGWKFRR
jgi:hypothetical protein